MQKIASLLDSAWNWLVLSSANATQVSLTVKGFLATSVAAVLGIIAAAHIQIPGLSDNLSNIANLVVLFITYGLGIVGVISSVIGFIRKIILSFSSTTISSF